MAVEYNPRIVTDGLVLCLDAANSKSYPKTGTSWFDLSGGNNNGTLTNGPAFSSLNGGSISFDGTNDLVNLTNTPNLDITTNDFALELWLYYLRSSASAAKVAARGAYLTTGWTIYAGKFGSLPDQISFQYGSTTWIGVGGLDVTENNWYHVCVTRLNGTITTYINNTNTGSRVDSYNFSSTNPTIIGRNAISGDWFKGSVAVFRQYNIGLNNNQVTQNFNALRGRFGI
jgi:hypothetical protein